MAAPPRPRLTRLKLVVAVVVGAIDPGGQDARARRRQLHAARTVVAAARGGAGGRGSGVVWGVRRNPVRGAAAAVRVCSARQVSTLLPTSQNSTASPLSRQRPTLRRTARRWRRCLRPRRFRGRQSRRGRSFAGRCRWRRCPRPCDLRGGVERKGERPGAQVRHAGSGRRAGTRPLSLPPPSPCGMYSSTLSLSLTPRRRRRRAWRCPQRTAARRWAQ